MDGDLRLLRPFLVAARMGSFTRAAADLGISQPRLSLLIKKLETQIGFALFRRANRRVELTEEGIIYLARAEDLQRATVAIVEAAREIRGELRHRLRIGSPSYQCEVPERNAILLELSTRHPSLRCKFDHAATPAVLTRLHAGELDAAFLTEPFDKCGLETIPVATGRAMLAMRADHPLARRTEIDFSDLAGYEVATQPKHIGAGYIDRWFGPIKAAGATLIEGEEEHYGAMIRFADRLNITTVVHIWSDQSANQLGCGRMVLRPIGDRKVDLEIILTRLRRTHSTAVESLWDIARARAAHEPAADEGHVRDDAMEMARSAA